MARRHSGDFQVLKPQEVSGKGAVAEYKAAVNRSARSSVHTARSSVSDKDFTHRSSRSTAGEAASTPGVSPAVTAQSSKRSQWGQDAAAMKVQATQSGNYNIVIQGPDVPATPGQPGHEHHDRRRGSLFERPTHNHDNRAVAGVDGRERGGGHGHGHIGWSPEDLDEERKEEFFDPKALLSDQGQHSPVFFPEQKHRASKSSIEHSNPSIGPTMSSSSYQSHGHHRHHHHHHHHLHLDMRRAGGFLMDKSKMGREKCASHLSVESDLYALNWRSPRLFVVSAVRKAFYFLSRARQAMAKAVREEVEATWGNSKTWQRLRYVYGRTCGRRRCFLCRRLAAVVTRRRQSARQASTVTTASSTSGGGGAPGAAPRAEAIQDIFARHTSDSGFGIPCFIIHNPGQIEDYFDIYDKELAVGGSGKILKAVERSTKVERAVKKIVKGDSVDTMRAVQEVKMMKDMDHPNIVKLFETFQDKRHLYLVMELCSGGDLLDRLVDTGPYSEFQAAVIVRTVLMTLNYLHANGWVHRDIKPENVMFKDSRREIMTSALRLVDFGFARNMPLDSPVVHTKVGSPYYIAPEVIAGEYDDRCDMWSIGVLTFVLLSGYPPFAGFTDAETLHLIRQGHFVFQTQHWENISKRAKHFIRHLLEVDVDRRMPLEAALGHPWCVARGQMRVERMREETVDRLLTFNSYHNLRRAAMLAVAYQLEAHEVKDLVQLFQGLDANGDGLLTTKEFVKGTEACGIDKAWIQRMMKSVDADNSGVIGFSEFLAATLDQEMYIKNHAALFRAFRCFDQDDGGSLTREEIAATLRMSQVEHIEEVQEFFEEVDLNGDGAMDYYEFYVMLQKEVDPERNDFPVEDDLLVGNRHTSERTDESSQAEAEAQGASFEEPLAEEDSPQPDAAAGEGRERLASESTEPGSTDSPRKSPRKGNKTVTIQQEEP